MVHHQHNFMVWPWQWKGAAEKNDFLHLTTQKNNVHPVPTNLNLWSNGSATILASDCNCSTYSLLDGPPPTQFHGGTWAVERCSWKKGLFAYNNNFHESRNRFVVFFKSLVCWFFHNTCRPPWLKHLFLIRWSTTNTISWWDRGSGKVQLKKRTFCIFATKKMVFLTKKYYFSWFCHNSCLPL